MNFSAEDRNPPENRTPESPRRDSFEIREDKLTRERPPKSPEPSPREDGKQPLTAENSKSRRKQEGMNLGNRTIDPPSGSHFPPVEDEFLFCVAELHDASFISVITEIYEYSNKSK